ncbi:MAG: ATP-binding protein [Bifidobacterium crudilactis]|uniref:ATP-binding protein n=1 Tax=Bifidobacterium crudilactis TaxID=327277 RepID=UPI003F9920B9
MIGETSYPVGVVISVDGDKTLIGTYDLVNDDEIIHNGQILYGPRLGACLTIRQNDVKLIAKITSEKIVDQQNTIKSNEFDNRYSKHSINRIISVTILGAIEDGTFAVTSSYSPMVGNETYITTQEELTAIYAIEPGADSITIGNALLERAPVLIPINAFFAGHIGIFGNTGSGKSNTLHALYYTLMQSKYAPGILKNSNLSVIDFNGEYKSNNIFGYSAAEVERYDVDTRSKQQVSQRVEVPEEYIINPDVLIMLFEARPGVQAPFLTKAIRKFEETQTSESFVNLTMGLLQRIVLTGNSIQDNALGDWSEVTEDCCGAECLSGLKQLQHNNTLNNSKSTFTGIPQYFNSGNQQLDDEQKNALNWNELEKRLRETYENRNIIRKLYMFLRYQRIYATAWNTTDPQYLGPLFSRIRTRLEALNKVVKITSRTNPETPVERRKPLTIYSFVHANQEIKRVLPMLIANMIYTEQKNEQSDKDKIDHTTHLIIDEAHNILSDVQRDDGDNWQSHRLDSFEEIIKEGRKFGFYLTIASQRPADISATILSQVHNYVIHRLVNDRDLRALENTMPTLDHSSLMTIPALGKGQAVLTGTAFPVPRFTKVFKIIEVAPSSADAILTDLWKPTPLSDTEQKPDETGNETLTDEKSSDDSEEC